MALPPNALARWAQRQRDLLDRFYDEAWARGVAAYVPDDDPDDESEPLTEQEQEQVRQAGPGSIAALIAARHRAYVAPTQPDLDRKRAALQAPLASVDRMIGEIASVDTTPETAPSGDHHSSTAALAAWAKSNSYRLAIGAGVVWAGEQHGFAQAATADGQLLIWVCAEDEASCQDCLDMADFPPTVEGDWPSLPGDGGTQCGGNCRCTMDYAPVGILAGSQ